MYLPDDDGFNTKLRPLFSCCHFICSIPMLQLFFLLSLSTTFASIFPPYDPCPHSSRDSPDQRRFYLSTFKTGNDTAPDVKFRLEGQGFNSSGGGSSGLQEIRIVGKELHFWKKRFFYHPYSSLQFVRDAIEKELQLGNDPNNAYSMHVDYDTVLTGTSMERLWEKFDCARKGKPILVAGETGCLAGGCLLHVNFNYVFKDVCMYMYLCVCVCVRACWCVCRIGLH